MLVGVPTPDMTLEMPLIDFFCRGGSLKSSWYGDCLPERDFPMLVDLYRQGRLPLEKFVTERITLDEVEARVPAPCTPVRCCVRWSSCERALRIERVVTEGTFALDGGEWNVDNNIWLIGDDPDVVIVDAAHAAQPIIDAVGDRHVNAVICTHGHNDHVTVAPELAERCTPRCCCTPATTCCGR